MIVETQERTYDLEAKTDRRALKLRILNAANKRRVQPYFVKELGYGEVIFLANIFRWDSRGSEPHGWIWQKVEHITENTGMGKDGQETARNRLVRKGFLEVAGPSGVPPRYWYRVNLLKVLELVDPKAARELIDLEEAFNAADEQPEEEIPANAQRAGNARDLKGGQCPRFKERVMPAEYTERVRIEGTHRGIRQRGLRIHRGVA